MLDGVVLQIGDEPGDVDDRHYSCLHYSCSTLALEPGDDPQPIGERTERAAAVRERVLLLGAHLGERPPVAVVRARRPGRTRSPPSRGARRRSCPPRPERRDLATVGPACDRDGREPRRPPLRSDGRQAARAAARRCRRTSRRRPANRAERTPGAPPSASTSSPVSSAIAGMPGRVAERDRLEPGVVLERGAGLVDVGDLGGRADDARRAHRRREHLLDLLRLVGVRRREHEAAVTPVAAAGGSARSSRWRSKIWAIPCSASASSSSSSVRENGIALGRPLHLDEAARTGHDHVHVDLGPRRPRSSRGRGAPTASTTPTEIAATGVVDRVRDQALRAATSREQASCSARYPPQIDAVRVPPSAWSTSQSTVICTSPIVVRSVTARSERPIRRWISCVRPDCFPFAASRSIRSGVDPGSIEYSAVTQPLPGAAQPRRDALLDRRGAQHPGSTELDEDRARRELGVVASERDGRSSSGSRPSRRIPMVLPTSVADGRWPGRPGAQILVTRLGAASVTASPKASDPSSTDRVRVEPGPEVREHQTPRPGLAGAETRLARREVDLARACRPSGTWPRRATRSAPARTRRRSSPGRCRRCRRAACRFARHLDGVRGRRVVGAREAQRRCRRRRPVAVVDRAARRTTSPQSPPTSEPRCSARPAGAIHREPLALEAVAHQHVQPVDVDAVVGMLVGDHDGGQVLGGDVLLEVAERAVAAVEPDRGVAGADEIATARGAVRPAEGTRAPEDGQLHDQASTWSTSGPRKRAPSARKVATSPLVTNECRGSGPGSGSSRPRARSRRRAARGRRTPSRLRSTPAPRPVPSHRRSYGQAAGSACNRARACRRRRRARERAGARRGRAPGRNRRRPPRRTRRSPGTRRTSARRRIRFPPPPAGTPRTRSCRRCR